MLCRLAFQPVCRASLALDRRTRSGRVQVLGRQRNLLTGADVPNRAAQTVIRTPAARRRLRASAKLAQLPNQQALCEQLWRELFESRTERQHPRSGLSPRHEGRNRCSRWTLHCSRQRASAAMLVQPARSALREVAPSKPKPEPYCPVPLVGWWSTR